MADMVERLVWLYYIAAIFTLVLGVWLGHVITLASVRSWVEQQLRGNDNGRE